MSDTQKNAEAPAGSDPKPQDDGGMKKVDEGVQEQAAEEREKAGGYD
jgi:hypothetical protein